MDSFSSGIVQDATLKMLGAFKDSLESRDDAHLKREWSTIINLILSSVTASMLHMWAENVVEKGADVVDYADRYGTALETMMLKVAANVMETYRAKMESLTPREVH